ncbi:hypothetical protein HXX76_014198 [Chlamydomonas incerta]|uniref:SET domain-containing protein n=1 Tax=Chlamydomonas incerta TaxID=51695 RepID=A0A835SM36_CHLIN|nr:hypothetical protein HXX76_014198 [Chlamydomonas incerta]|eukprot:KAG2424774.1 hypothetical protein HXX76_014198 [Chlamydomonas incerta]
MLAVFAWLAGAVAICCTCVGCAVPVTPLAPRSDATPAEQALINWLQDLGAEVGVTVRRDDTSGVRGLAAAARTSRGEVLVRVPLAAALALGTAEQTAPELAIQMLRERHRTRPRYGPYFDVLPPPPPEEEEEADTPRAAGLQPAAPGGWQPSCVEEFPRVAVEALAGADLRALASAKREWLRQVWAGEGPAAALRLPLARAVPRRVVGLREFAWATCMVTSRSIAGPPAAVGSSSGSSSGASSSSPPPATMLLIPLIDLANHCALGGANQSSSSSSSSSGSGSDGSSGGAQRRSAPDVLRFRAEGAAGADAGGGGAAGRVVLELVAGEDLEPGQEVCISYGDLRPDESLLYYGFLQPVPAAAEAEAAAEAAEAALTRPAAQQQDKREQQQASGQQQCSAAATAGQPAAAASPDGSGGGSSSREGSCGWDGAAGPASSPPLLQQLLPLAAVDEAQYDAAARPGKGSYSRVGEGVEGAEGHGSEGLTWAAALEAEVERLTARLAEVQAEAEAAWAGAAAGCPRRQSAVAAAGAAPCGQQGGQQCSSTPEAVHAPVCLVAQLNEVRAAALRAELGRLQRLRAAAALAAGL